MGYDLRGLQGFCVGKEDQKVTKMTECTIKTKFKRTINL
jgi:uncharacterized protein YwbE